MNVKNTFVAGMIATAMFGIAGCSSDDDSKPKAKVPPFYELEAPLAAQTATIQIHNPTGIPTVTIATQPANIALSGTATRTATDTVELVLSATNNAPRILFNLKAVVDSTASALGVAAITGSDGTFDTEDFVRFNLGIAEEATSESGDLTISGIDGAVDPLVLEVTLPTNHPLAIINPQTSSNDSSSTPGDDNLLKFVDLVANESINVDFTKLNNPNYNQNGSDGQRVRRGVFSPEGQYAYFGLRNVPWLLRVDMTSYNDDSNTIGHDLLDLSTGKTFTPADLADPDTTDTQVLSAYIDWVTMSPNQQYLYAAYGVGAHVYGSNSQTNPQTVSLVKIDRANMEIVESVQLVNSTAEPRVRDYDFVDDSTMVVILESDDETVTPASVITIDLAEMEVTGTVDISPLGTATNTTATPANEPTQMALSANGAVAYVAFRSEPDVYTVNLASGDTDAMGTTLTDYFYDITLGPDGMLYVNSQGDGLVQIDTANSNAETVIHTTTGNAVSFAFSADDANVFIRDSSGGSIESIFGYKLSDGSQLDLDGDTTDATPGSADTINGVTIWDHVIMVSPY